MIYNIHAGHAKVGGGAIGAVGYLSESVEDRKIKNLVIKQLRKDGHTVYDCTTDRGTQSQVLSGIVKKCNAHAATLDVSIHFNSGVRYGKKNGKTTGTEVWVKNPSGAAAKAARRIADNIAYLGFKNRGVKSTDGLYVLNKTKAPALLIEVCFVDDADDAALYKSKYKAIAMAIVRGLEGKPYA